MALSYSIREPFALNTCQSQTLSFGLVGQVAGLRSRGSSLICRSSLKAAELGCRAHLRVGDLCQGRQSAEGADAVFGCIVLEERALAAIPFPLLSHISQIHIALNRYFVLLGEIIKKKSLSHWLIIKFST